MYNRNQNRTPLIDAMENFIQGEPAFFRIPAHRFDRGVDARALQLLGSKVYKADLTEAEGLDDLHHPEGAIRDAEELAAELFQADRCWFLVNGTTCGNEAMILAALQPGDKILLPRNAHKSVLMGVILAGAIPVWIMPEYLEEWQLYGVIRPSDVRDALEKDPDIKAVFLVSPTYYGIRSDIRRIADICHFHGVPLLVDEAHGSHLYFSEKLPEGAIQSGADAAAQSIHKTAGSMTQSSMLQMKSRLIDPARLDECLKLVMSTSPNYVLMASLDGARHALAMHGRAMMERALELAEKAAAGLESIEGIRVLHTPRTGIPYDPLRLVFSAAELGIGGYELQERIYAIDHVSTELADFRNVVAVVTWANTEEDIRRLVEAVRKAAVMRKGQKNESSEGTAVQDPAGADAGDEIDTEESSALVYEDTHLRMEEKELVQMVGSILQLPETVLRPREAFYAKKDTIPWSSSVVGMIAAEAVIPYPPGIPLLNPGERITEEIYRTVENYRRAGLPIHGPADPELETIQIIAG